MGTISWQPATLSRWDDLEAVFGPHGAYAGCWCMYWRLKRAEFDAAGSSRRRLLLKERCAAPTPPGILYYDDNVPFGWCSVAPRSDYPVLGRSPLLRPVDPLPVWSITCFFIEAAYRGSGLLDRLVRFALDYAAERGAAAVEAYPNTRAGDVFEAYMGYDAVYRRIGFAEVARRREHRPILRFTL